MVKREVARHMRLGNLSTPNELPELPAVVPAKAKGSPEYRVYSLYDREYRADWLTEAYRRCRANGGAPGTDGERFEDIKEYGEERWLGELAQELKEKRYRAQAIRRVFIPKPNGKLRPLGISPIRDRVVMM